MWGALSGWLGGVLGSGDASSGGLLVVGRVLGGPDASR
jgi:hypothetical protein